MANPVENTSAQNEVALAAVRQPAVNALLDHARDVTWGGAAFTTTAMRTAQGLQLDTVDINTRAATTMTVNGGTAFAPAAHPRATIAGDVSLTGAPGAIAAGQYDRHYPLMPGWFGTGYSQFSKSLQLKDAAGRPLVTLDPATYSFAQKSDGTTLLDPNNQPVRETQPTSWWDNCKAEPGTGYSASHPVECTFVMSDQQHAPVSYTDTQSLYANGVHENRAVVRTMDGRTVLGVVDTTYSLDQKGDPYNIRTVARRPDQLKL